MKLVNKKNIYILSLVVICLLMIVIVPTYAKFASNYTTDDDIVGLSLDFDIGISNIEEYEEIVVSAGSSEAFNVEITNSSGSTVYYGIWYKMVQPSEINSNIEIGRSTDSTVSTSGSIENGESVTATIVIRNTSTSEVKINIGVNSSTTSTSDVEYLGGKYLITGVIEDKIYLSSVAVGSYVSYTGGNGSTGENVSDGYCYNSSYTYGYSGFRVAYVDGGSAYIVTGGSPECLGLETTTSYVDNVAADNATSTSESWTQSSYSTTYKYYYGSTYSFDDTTGIYSLSGNTTQFTISYSSSSIDYASYPYTCKSTSSDSETCTTIYKVTGYSYNIMSGGTFTASSYTSTLTTVSSGTVDDLITNLNSAALSYCNTLYAYNGTCDSNSAWAINGTDYNKITGITFTNGTTAVTDANEIIGNGGFYWFANSYSTSNLYLWDPSVNYINNNIELNNSLGLRPIIKLNSGVYVTGGSGTSTDPYTIDIE